MSRLAATTTARWQFSRLNLSIATTSGSSKGGVEDLQKAKHFIDLLISLETKSEKPCNKGTAP